MCYRCGICSGVTKPRESLRTLIVTRVVPPATTHHPLKKRGDGFSRMVAAHNPERTEIEREIPVCGRCHLLAKGGMTAAQIRRALEPVPPPTAQPPAPVPKPKPQPLTGRVLARWRHGGKNSGIGEDKPSSPPAGKK